MNACITSPIAIIGVGLRLPGAVNHLDALWKILQEGRDCISEIPEDRFNAWRFYHPDRTHPGTSVCMQAGLLDSIYAFDCDFFGISLKEASAMDPQQRILLELTWEALEDAGIKPSSLSGSDTCVYVGAASPDSGTCHADDLCSSSPYSMTGTNLSIIANRISYIFNWHGPSFTLDTACSSSMYALHTACQTLAQGGASLAIAAGVNVLLAPYAFVGFSQAYMLSPEGRCKVFDAKGNGYVRSEGGGVLVLEPLELALAQGHNIKAIIRGIGCNSDGRTQGIALPSAKAQEELLATIYDQANCDPETLSYLEAHGTGTVVGDPIEVRAIGRALAQKRSQALPLGSIKCHVGHLETASAMAGIMKALTLMRYQKITPQIHLEELNPEIDFAALKVRVPLEMEDLPSQGTPFRIGVNSFGFGGANGHVLLEAPNNNHQPKIYAQGTPSALPPLFLQAKSETSLTKLAFMVGERITPSNYAALASTLALRRESMPYRLVAEAKDLETLKEALKSPNLDSQNLIFGQSNLQDTHPQTAFVFTGNGCHWLGMAQDLLSWPTFLNKVKEVSDLFYDLSQVDLLTSLKTATKEDLEKTELTQPLIFMIQMGLCEILAEQGIKPDVVFGHSVGEVAAVQAAGLLSLSDAVKVIYYRSLYQGKTKGLGQMAAAKLEVGEALDLISKVAFQEVEIA
ncbi:MAG: type I polyketide synthase, partial [Desulfovibrionaceae bacterium]|nr:type I polyketide synthase [Desulfovibrionaceae bacterium]